MKFKVERSVQKIMAIVFWDSEGNRKERNIGNALEIREFHISVRILKERSIENTMQNHTTLKQRLVLVVAKCLLARVAGREMLISVMVLRILANPIG